MYSTEKKSVYTHIHMNEKDLDCRFIIDMNSVF